MRTRLYVAALWTLGLAGRADIPPATTTTPIAERQTPAQWLQAIENQNVEARKYEDEHPADTLVLYGATQIFPAYHTLAQLSQWPAKYQDGNKAYLNWWKGDGGLAFNKWRQSGFPVTTDKTYYLFFVIAMSMADTPGTSQPDLAQYKSKVLQRGQQLFLQGCSGQGLSSGELDELRLYAMYCNQMNVWPPCLLPSYLGWMSGDAVGVNADQGSIGTPAPDFTLPQLEEILARPSYSDEDPSDEMNIFRPVILKNLLQVMNGYEAAPAAQKNGPLLQAKPYDHSFKDPVSLSSFKGKKPVVLMFEDASDTWCVCGHVAPLWGPLHQTIKDRAEIFFVHTTVPDQIMPGFAGANMSIPGQKALQPVTLEARARTAKMCYMYNPALSVPYLLDDLGQHVKNAYQCGGGETATVLVDKKGVISYSLYQRPESSAYMWLDGGVTYGVAARNQRVMNLVECNLKALLDAGGVWNSQMKPVIPDWRLSPSLENVQLTKVDTQAGLITVIGKNNQPLSIAVDDGSRILLAQKQGSLGDLKAGQVMSIYYERNPAGTGWVARLIATRDAYDSYWDGGWWLPAVVQSTDPATGALRVKLTLSEQDCKGLAFWKTASPEMIQLLGDGYAGVRQAFDLLAPATGARLVTLHVDRATELFLDGMKAKLSDLKPGDPLGVPISDFKADEVWPAFIRVYRY